MPLSEEESFPTRLQTRNRIQVPVLVRWRHRMEPGEVVYVKVYSPKSYSGEEFYAKLLEDGRITVPKLAAEILGIKPSDVVYVTLYPKKPTEEK